ncbi:MAG: NAD-dependent protein deacylase [bacterium]|nr:NAD-dependent protein deacylase [bacterium]
MNEEAIHHAREVLNSAGSVFVLTGAGVSAESGVSTFRGQGGLWNKIDPMTVATPEAFARDPEYVWRWYDARRAELQHCRPNPGHFALAQLERNISDYFLLTQNVDDLHEQAGSRNLAHIHGRIWEVRCTREDTAWEDRRAPLPEIPPRCPQCGALLRPNVVWFGEIINREAIDRTERFLAEREVDTVIIAGTQAQFPYIIHWAQSSRGARGTLIEINTEETAFSPYADLSLRGASGVILPQIVRDFA